MQDELKLGLGKRVGIFLGALGFFLIALFTSGWLVGGFVRGAMDQRPVISIDKNVVFALVAIPLMGYLTLLGFFLLLGATANNPGPARRLGVEISKLGSIRMQKWFLVSPLIAGLVARFTLTFVLTPLVAAAGYERCPGIYSGNPMLSAPMVYARELEFCDRRERHFEGLAR